MKRIKLFTILAAASVLGSAGASMAAPDSFRSGDRSNTVVQVNHRDGWRDWDRDRDRDRDWDRDRRHRRHRDHRHYQRHGYYSPYYYNNYYGRYPYHRHSRSSFGISIFGRDGGFSFFTTR